MGMSVLYVRVASKSKTRILPSPGNVNIVSFIRFDCMADTVYVFTRLSTST
jgi:hypothetical protein